MKMKRKKMCLKYAFDYNNKKNIIHNHFPSYIFGKQVAEKVHFISIVAVAVVVLIVVVDDDDVVIVAAVLIIVDSNIQCLSK